MLGGQARVQGLQLLLGGALGYAGPESHDGGNIQIAVQIHGHGQPAAFVGIPAEARRHHADNGARLIVESQLLAYGVGAAIEEALPGFVAQNDHRFRHSAGRNIGRLNGAADHRRDAQKLKSIGGDEDGREPLRRVVAGEQGPFRIRGHYGRKRR